MALNCPNHPDREAVVGVMVYGPEGGTTDLCGDCLAEWALSIAEGAYGPLAPDATRSPETAATAPNEGGGPDTQGGRKSRRTRRQEPQTDPEPVEPADAEVSGSAD